MTKYIGRFIFILSCAWVSPNTWANDSQLQSLDEERKGLIASTSTKQASRNVSLESSEGPRAEAKESVVLPQAENIDLKEVVEDPNNLPATKPAPAKEVDHKQTAEVKQDGIDAPGESSSLQGTEENDDDGQTPLGVETNSGAGVDQNTDDKDAVNQSESNAPEVETTVEASKANEAQPEESNAAQAIRILGAEVPPSTATRLAWSAQHALQGISVPTPVLVVHGAKTGPILCLTGAVHGDELNGIEVVRKVLYNLEPERLSGTVIGVPIVNLQGFTRASRYLTDRRDLNRYFPGDPDGSSAARIAHSFFKQVIEHCDYLIDVHTGSFRRTNLPQLRADLHVDQVAEMTLNLGSIVVLHSEGAVGSLRRAAVEAGIVAVTIEAGEPLNVSIEAVNHGVRSIENFMQKMEMYKHSSWFWATSTKPVFYSSLWVRSEGAGILLSEIKLGERVTEGQLLGQVTDPITNVSSEIRSPISGQVIGMALNQIMLGGFAAYHIGYQATLEEAATQDAGPDDYEGDDTQADLEAQETEM